MGLTRPRFSQFDTTISSISDPVTVLNKSATLANIDIGFVINRNGGVLANTAIFWNESANTFALAFTTNTGELPNANIAISEYANLKINTLTADTATFSSTGAIKIPTGNTAQRTAGTTGQIRFNTSTSQFEGYQGASWSSLGGVRSVDNNTYIIAESSAGAGDNILQFFAGGNRQANLSSTGLTVTGNIIIGGNLTVQGTTTTLNSTTLDVTDLNITVAKGAATAAAANGAGLTVDGAGATLLYTSSTDSWNINKTLISNSFVNTSGNISTAQLNAGQINTTGNVLATTGVFNALTVNGVINTTGNIMSGGNVTAPYFFGNGSQLSGVITSVTKIINGTSDVTAYSGSNIAVTVGGTANTILFTNSITSTSNVTGALRVSGLGGIGVGGNLYVGQRVGFVWGANNVSSVYQVFNNSTNSLDTVFG